ncbi:MAG: tRNA pseudouridine(55) synthase TruB [Bacteroidetes bacterium CG02_land_8_20_14_3_00_31_25]|nr:MAG: tRNA pseudouridine(55) synthase TruB [Bacteroidetes bacterium CG02_land_8_20_14_3_00_31_25]PIX32959.1 MAG: tRNA pseudouridine(55) synthase TruB [Bacteroidetes bacterium CG_4_8_14_3_um_filter_31_14]
MDFVENENGTLLIDKPYRWTSFDVVNKLRNLIKKQTGKRFKVGHAGTLDPLATGLLIICYGKETKSISQFMDYEKEYIATFKFGATTPCYDLEKPINQTFPFKHITKDMVEKVLLKYTGEQEQMPPIFSAKQIDGKRAYKIARQGENPEVKTQKINIYKLELVNFELPEIVVKIVCSKGTYIRALARDFGNELKSGAHLTALRRTRIGKFNVSDAVVFDLPV